jgi:hypothetical protein
MHHAGAGVLFHDPRRPLLYLVIIPRKKVPGKKYILLVKMVI